MFIADFHIHSKYSRATSKNSVPETLELWARRKGLDLIGTGDFTHAGWRGELKEKLIPDDNGLYTLKDACRLTDEQTGIDTHPRFIVSGEISSIYKKNARVRKVHNLILLPSLEAADALSHRLEAIGNLHSDGRPILGLDSRDLLEIMLETVPDGIFIPAHIWTPHFSLFGAYSGFDDIHECFEDLTPHIHALETGLSSDPPMNWRISALDKYNLVSNSDAHSPAKLAREANLFDTTLSYAHIAQALDRRSSGLVGTLEFFPEEGKYHYDGHRKCSVCQTPSDTIASYGKCPVCGKRITVGVLHRVEDLADREKGFVPAGAKPFESLIPLPEIVACSIGMTTASKKVMAQYFDLMRRVGPELYILRQAPLEDIAKSSDTLLAEGIRRLRAKEVHVTPGFDGEYGKIEIFTANERRLLSGQVSFFSDAQDEAAQSRSDLVQSKNPITDKTKSISKSVTSSPVASGMNPQQQEAVCADEPAVAVIAGPGTGKTRTLVNRIVHLVETHGVSPALITAVTFTNKAAEEMRTRLSSSFTDKRLVSEMTIGTFHSICLKYLSDSGQSVSIISEQNALGIIRDILRQLNIKQSPRKVLQYISLFKCGLPAASADTPEQIINLYQEALNQYGAMDFDDILLNALSIFEDSDFSDTVPFTHVLVDEFQDINPVQYRLVKAWSKHSDSVFVIGDPDQSIYGFRGADPACFNQFMAEYPDVRRIQLVQNYRSTPEILKCAQAVIVSDDSKEMLAAQKPGGLKVRLLTIKDAFSEALFVAKEINRMVGGLDMLEVHHASAPDPYALKRGFSDIAVLYRTNRQARAIEQCLLKEDIPYIVAGRDDFLSDPEVSHALAFFRYLVNPGDMLSLKTCLGVSLQNTESIRQILDAYAQTEKTPKALSEIIDNMPPDLTMDTSVFNERLLRYLSIIQNEKPGILVESWIKEHALEDSAPMKLFAHTAVMYADVPSFLNALMIGQDSDVMRSGKRSYSPDAVTLMTLHCAKGLEFPAVFLCGVSDGFIPFRHHSGSCDLDEEWRLFYVGMTRAQDELILLTSPAGSPFLADLPADCLIREDALPQKSGVNSKQISFF